MPHIRLRDVQAEYELLTVRDYNLKRQLLEVARRRIDPPAVIRALNGVNLELPEGSRLGLVGANGAGKSTLLSVMAGLLPPTSGSVEVEGRVLALLGSAAAGLDQEAAGLDNIVSMGVQLGETPSAMRRRTDDITDFSGLGGRIAHPVYTYSSGMQTRLRFSILTSLRPDILLIDEGIGTADAEFAERASQRLDEFVSGAGILVLASHGDALLQQQCDTAVWLHQGSIMRSGRLEPILAEYHASYQVDPTDDAPKTLQARVRDLSAPAPPAPARSPRVIDSPVTPTEDTTLTPGHEADVTRGYWELLDRAPDPDGLALHAARLREGLPLEQLRRDLHTSPEAQAIRDAWSGEVYLGLSHDIPYSSTPRPGAQHLVVSFPGVGTHRFIPAADDPVIDDIAVHRLALGLARARPWKAAEWTSWVHDAAALIHQVAEQLGVELANVICVGASTKGTRALWVGLVAAVGHVAVGSPAMPMGTSLEKLYLRARGDVDSWILFESLYVPSGFADDLSQRDAMDRVIPHAVGAAQHPCDIQLFASRGDVFWKPCEDFVESLAGHRSLTGSLVEGDYRGHNAVGPQYNAFLRRILLTLVRPKRSTRVKPESVGARPARGTKKG